MFGFRSAPVTIDVTIDIDKIIVLPSQVSPTVEELFGEIIKELKKMTEASENLAREVAETREAVNALTGRYQTKIDQMQVDIDALKEALANGDTEAANAAAQALDDLQTEMSNLGTEPAPEEG